MHCSVLIATFNSFETLPAAIDSVLPQLLDGEELVVIDDGSTDGTSTYLQSIPDSRLRVSRQTNKGLAAALNTGLRLCQNEIVVRLDSDDEMLPGRLACHRSAFSQNDRLVLHGGNIVRRSDDGHDLGCSSFPQKHADIVRGLMRGRHVLCHSAVAYRRETVLACGGHWTGGVGQGWEWW